jgi:hypothetical protein
MITAIILAAMSVTLSLPADPIGSPNADPILDRKPLPPPPRFTELFTKGSNEGDWSWGGGFQSIQAKGGNTKWYLRTEDNDTFAPQVATAFGIESEFTGNFREKRIFCVGADFITERVDFSAAERPMSLLLTSDPGTPDDPLDDCTVYSVGAAFAPEPGDGWRHYEFFLPPPFAPHVLPSGWSVLEGCTEPTPDDAWNRVLQDVDEVRFFYGDPTYFFIFQNFTVGVDNIFAEVFSQNPR